MSKRGINISKSLRERSIKAFLDIIILYLLKQHSMTGYEIEKIIVKKFGVIIGPSKVYNTLITMERHGQIICTQNRSGRIYCLTEEGIKKMAELPIIAKEVQKLSNNLSRVY
jgi:DNA-binding PadR family transcriptional regulator